MQCIKDHDTLHTLHIRLRRKVSSRALRQLQEMSVDLDLKSMVNGSDANAVNEDCFLYVANQTI
jgi:hypothetical protein